MHVLPEFDRKITQRNIGGGHRYKVEGFDCTTCANCRKGKPCIGLPSVTGITGKYSDGNMYGAGYSAAFNTVFGSYTNSDKTALDDTGVLQVGSRTRYSNRTPQTSRGYTNPKSERDSNWESGSRHVARMAPGQD
jgi:hypothetical protein